MEQVRNEERGRRNLRGDGNEITDVAQGDKPKKGRPKNDESKKFTRSINLKLTEDDFKAIAQKAASVGMKPTQYARRMVLDGSIKSRYTKEELDLRRKVAGMANNLNRFQNLEHKPTGGVQKYCGRRLQCRWRIFKHKNTLRIQQKTLHQQLDFVVQNRQRKCHWVYGRHKRQ